MIDVANPVVHLRLPGGGTVCENDGESETDSKKVTCQDCHAFDAMRKLKARVDSAEPPRVSPFKR